MKFRQAIAYSKIPAQKTRADNSPKHAIAHPKPQTNRGIGGKSGHLYELLSKLLSSGREK
jgi:hypothetical protein